jgi:hypothetical protein
MKTVKPREVRYEGVHCHLTIQQFSRRVVVLKISGTDIGEFGEEPLIEMDQSLAGADQIELFIDARDVRGASIDVSGNWARWLQKHKAHLRSVSMLSGSRLVQITADFVRRFADLERIMRVYIEPAAFDAALAESIEQP